MSQNSIKQKDEEEGLSESFTGIVNHKNGTKYWYLNGKKLSEKEWKQKVEMRTNE